MTKLVTLSGNAVIKESIAPLMKIDPRQLDDYAAGLVFLTLAARLYPGLKWGDLLQPERLSGWLTDAYRGVKNFAGDIYGGVKTVLGDVKDGIGDVGGSAIRLVTDEDVLPGVMQAASAYATGGQSLAYQGALDQIFGPGGSAAQYEVVSQAGQSYKSLFGEIPKEYIWIGGGALALLLIIALMR